MQFDIDSFEHGIQVNRDLGIPEANNAIPFLLKPQLSLEIASSRLIIIVMSAIEFNDEMLGRTKEVHNIGTDWRLPAEMRTVHGKLS